jgi:ribosomal protein S18 acetylase RimI-like enzyme
MTIPSTTPPREAITFRRCVEADVPFLRHLYGTTREAELRHVDWTGEQKRVFLDMQFQAQKMYYEEQYPGCAFLVIELEGRPIGRLYLDRGDDDIRIVDIALLPERRGLGIGRMLMEEILAEGEAARKAVTIHVEHDNPAMRLYTRLGFRHVDTNGVYHLMEWRAAPRAAREHSEKGQSWTSHR